MGVILAVLKILGGAAGITAALLGDKYGVRWPHAVGLCGIALGLAMVNKADTMMLYAIGCWMWEFGFALSQCYQMAAVARLDVCQRMVSLIPAALAIGAAIGPGVAGFLKTGESYLPIFIFATSCAVFSTIVFFFLMSPRRHHLGR